MKLRLIYRRNNIGSSQYRQITNIMERVSHQLVGRNF